MKISIVILGILSTVSITYGAPPNTAVLCQINPFQEKNFKQSLLFENHLMCPDKGDTLRPGQFCEHLYKCPLDFEDKFRHCEAICKSDGTFDYKYPTCDDLVPLADAILEAIEKEETIIGKEVIELNLRKKRSFGWGDAAELEQPEAEQEEDPEGEPGELIKEKEYENLKKQVKETIKEKSISKVALRAICKRKMCNFLNKEDVTCESLAAKVSMADFSLQAKLCKICVHLGACKKDIDLFTSG